MKQNNATVAQILIRWSLQKGFGTEPDSLPYLEQLLIVLPAVPLPKSDTPGRIQENFDVFGITLDDDDMRALDSLDQGKAVSWNPVQVE